MCEERDADSPGGSCDARLPAETEGDPGCDRHHAHEHRKSDEHAASTAIESDGHQCQGRDGRCCSESDLHDRDEFH
ncbi:MAG: hypothetical protein ACXVRV_13200, partial [Gaiellaceae bacterium]